MTQREVERHWGGDRRNLADCGRRHGAVVDYYRHRDKELGK